MKLVSTLVLALTFGWFWTENPSTLPDAYKLQFENEWVRVTRVRYEPLSKLTPHSHTPWASAYVYLNDGGAVVFRHVGGANTAAVRPPTKAGSFRVYRGLEEIHEVENTAATPSEFLRVEFKTKVVDPAAFRGKFHREAGPAATDRVELVQFDHPQMSISHLVLPQGGSYRASDASRPSLYIALSSTEVRVKTDQRSSDVRWSVGSHYWAPQSEVHRVENVGSQPAELLKFWFKTDPE